MNEPNQTETVDRPSANDNEYVHRFYNAMGRMPIDDGDLDSFLFHEGKTTCTCGNCNLPEK